MKIKNKSIKESGNTWSLSGMTIKSFALMVIIWTNVVLPGQAQTAQYTTPSWWFGVAGGANLNYYRGSTQELNASFTSPVAFNQGNGAGLFLAPVIEYHAPGSGLGFQFQAGYDSRSSDYNQEITPCNCPADLSTKLSYVTVEPSLRLAPFHGNFYLLVGPRFAFNTQKSFTYKLGINPAFPDQLPTPDVKGDLSHVRSSLISMQVGAGYDIPLTSQNRKTQFVFSPFVSYHPYFGQNPRSIETWNVTTVRIGAALKFGCGNLIPSSEDIGTTMLVPMVKFSVNSPKNIPVERTVKEIFPLRNYVFFDLGSTAIPDRYVSLRKDQVKDFKEDQLDQYKPKNLSGRSERQMVVYYNVINILGDRMGKDPSIKINLVGSSEKGPEDGKLMAESVKTYLVNVFAINESRISIEGRDKPKIPSEQPGGVHDLDLLRAGDRRVSIESSSPSLLMEFQSGPEALLRPVEITAVQVAPLDSYVTFNAPGAIAAFSKWSVEVRDEKGQLQTFGPYMGEKVSIPGKSILGTRPQGDYKMTMVGQAKNGKVVRQDANVHMVLWTPPATEAGMRYSILFEFNDSNANTTYDKYLTDIVTARIPVGGKVIIHGHTDIIGAEANNVTLSIARANEAKSIIESALAKAGRKDVTFEVYGFGEDESMAPFENTYPEERFYNRTVIIDIIPGRK